MVDSGKELADSLFCVKTETRTPRGEAHSMMAIMESFPVAIGRGGLSTVLPSLETETLERYTEVSADILDNPLKAGITDWDENKYSWVKMVRRLSQAQLEQRQRTGFQPSQLDYTMRAAFRAAVVGTHAEATVFLTEIKGLDLSSLKKNERNRLSLAAETILKALRTKVGGQSFSS